MKEKLINLTQDLAKAGFNIKGIEVEASDIVRIRFNDLEGFELQVNEDFAKIDTGNCPAKALKKIKAIIKSHYDLKDKLESIDDDMFTKLMNAS